MAIKRQGKNSRKDDHDWTIEDCIVGFYYHKWGTKFLEIDEQEIADIIGTTVASMKMQQSNFRMIETGKGLSDYSGFQKEVYDKYKNSPRYTVFQEVKKHLHIDAIILKRLLNRKSFGGYRKLIRVEPV